MSSLIANFSTAESGCSVCSSALSSATAWGTVRGNPSRMNLPCVGLGEAIHHHAHDELVGNVLAAVHECPGPDAEPGATLHVLAQDVTGRDLRDAEAIHQQLGLRSLPAPAVRAAPAASAPTSGSLRSVASAAETRSVSSSRARRRPRSGPTPNGNCWKSQILKTIVGIRAIAARKSGVRQRDAHEDVVEVGGRGPPGRMPGMKPPCLRRLSACLTGSNWIAV